MEVVLVWSSGLIFSLPSVFLDLVDLRKENIRLLQRIDSMREKEKDYLAQIDKVSLY